jgi:glycosyltransferase involved in cell wall biosynthesis
MRRCLFLAYHFPPIGLSGVQRTVKFVRYLPEQGWEPSVLTGPAVASAAGLPLDFTLAGELPDGLEIVRVEGPEPSPSTGRRGRLDRWMMLERPWSRWWIDGLVAAAGTMSRPVDVIVASMSPFDTAEAAARISAATSTPWIADLRDPWALDEMLVFASRVHRRHELAGMRRNLASAAAIVMNTEEAARAVGDAFPELCDRPIVAITNGYDATDFGGPDSEPDPAVFTIAHTGSFHTAAGRARRTMRARRALGGTIGNVDFLPRSHVFLVEAVRRLVEAEPELRDRIRLRFAGVMTSSDRAECGIDGIEELGYVEHSESIAVLRSADLLFFPMHGVASGYRARIVPGKAYEYLAAEKPILAAVPDGDARDLFSESPTGFVCGPDDVEGMARIIREQIRLKDAGVLPPRPPAALLARYERRGLTARLAALLSEVADRADPAQAGQARPSLAGSLA